MNASPCFVSNEFKIGYGEKLDLFPRIDTDEWRVQFAKVDRPVADVWTECQIQAVQYQKKYATQIDVFYSGGIDSEFLLKCFKQAQVRVRVLTARFLNGLNQHDLEFTEKFKKENPEFVYEQIDIDIEKFLTSEESLKLADESKCTLPHLLLLMKLMKKSQNPIILATGEPYIQKVDDQWFLRERESIASLYRYFNLNNLSGTHAFFQTSPEVFYSYLADPVLKSLTQNEVAGKLSSLSSRHKIYSQYVSLEERPKYHGYERIEPLVLEFQNRLEKKFSGFKSIKYFPYAELQQKIQII